MATAKPGGQSGFTLLETLVALVVLGLLVGGLAQGMRAGFALWQAQGRQLADRGDFDAADRTLRALIARIDPGGPSGRDPGLIGTASTLTFITTLPQAATGLPTPQAEVMLAVDGTHAAQLLWRPHYGRRLLPSPSPDSISLLRDVERLELAYWEPVGKWRSEWKAGKLPRLIRIRFVFTRQSGRTAPMIVVQPMRDRWRQ